MGTIEVRLDAGSSVEVERSVFTALFDASVVASRAPYLHALERSRIKFDDLVKLARIADIPYSLVFAPLEAVERQLQKKSDTLLAGVSKDAFSLNSRSEVRLRDVELIVKDLLRKQELLKKLDDTLVKNAVVGCLRGSRDSVAGDAARLRDVLGFTLTDVKAAKKKSAALDLLIGRFEAKQLLVSQSQQDFMPQRLPRHAKFSGLCVRDKKVPFIFLTGGDAGANPEPAGRKLFTLVLLAVLVAQGKFAPVTYDDHTAEQIVDREYELAGEVLMPRLEVRELSASTLDGVVAGADVFKVTPSAFVMRALRLGLISREKAEEHLEVLAAEFAKRPKRPARRPRPENALRKYNGTEFSRRMVHQLDRGAISQGEFRRVVLLNKLKATQIQQFREAL
ncbi:hypothetical protein [Nocardioides koreensis]|uniref:ImmA/IrrE family metallo-endopeptidase n=1 Tax=Nocardioides koreensis TaxID=433651 RepID=UPI0031E2EFE1